MNPWRFNIEGVTTQQSYRKHPCPTIMTTLSGEIKYKCDFDAVNWYFFYFIVLMFPARIHLLKVNNRNTRTSCQICWKLTVKNQNDAFGVVLVSLLLTWTYFTACSSVSIVNFQHVIADWVAYNSLKIYCFKTFKSLKVAESRVTKSGQPYHLRLKFALGCKFIKAFP